MERVTQVVKTPMTLEAYTATPETMLPMELINGELIRYPMPRDAHQSAVGNTVFFLKKHIPTGKTIISPMDVHLGDDVLQPDVFWVSPNSQCQLGADGWWYGAPDLVVEVLESPKEPYDRGIKFKLYEQYGVREYWLVDPIEQYIEVFTLQDNQFIQQGLYTVGDTFTSPVLDGQTIDVTALFES